MAELKSRSVIFAPSVNRKFMNLILTPTHSNNKASVSTTDDQTPDSGAGSVVKRLHCCYILHSSQRCTDGTAEP